MTLFDFDYQTRPSILAGNLQAVVVGSRQSQLLLLLLLITCCPFTIKDYVDPTPRFAREILS